ncbi:MAG: sulfite exporter TauE/SafE family protein [Prevotellaceae bacterium]|jgi:uncharacterized membrane protein YfcA|nr:sulfite exporter TauE/SafE family protein [Prevotellaceae bacterium]
MELAWYIYAIVLASGVLCGIINTLAGGGSLITLPVLMTVISGDQSAAEANVTNRLGFLFQSIVASARFKKKRTFEWSWGIRPAIPLTLGTLIGAWIAVLAPNDVIRHATGVVLIFMLPMIFLQPEKWLKNKVTAMPQIKWWLYPVYFAVGVYAGFLQAGIGYFLLILLVLGSGYDLLTANSIKVFVVLFTTIAALIIFFIHAGKVKIHYDVGILQAAGQAAGAWIGVKFATTWKPQIIRWLLITLIIVFAVKLLAF